jgi:hypothetical protein
MTYSTRSLISSLLLAGIILLAGCSGSPANPTPPSVQTPVQAAAQPPTLSPSGQNPISGEGTADNATSAAAQPQPPLPNRIDVIYFHVNQRCPTCLCFEERVNQVIKAYFSDALNSGNLTYRVLNAQQEQNANIARKYGVVGSQLFINTVVNGKDNIKDIKEIWDWNCRAPNTSFDGKVRSIIEESVKGLP